ncbi:MAG: Asp-tRNA(Asn)/Glu-tRNA(Gln) amidotransferase subunit GatB [Spirochaetes bacterium]|nr:Asp-tRNA(Asn)/Glu-tRNA(Gln) amidotransferase subunit GatB [Spirochaetota bacterium]
MEFEAVIGLEVHVQLNTATKIFCGCKNAFGASANTQTCPVCQGHPGVLPVLNREVLSKAMTAALAINATIAPETRFDRKHYFYPDLPKAYQISQFDMPLCSKGVVHITVPRDDGTQYEKDIGVTRIHMEEDAGKLVHDEHGEPVSYVDLNRAGTPLIEIVSEPELKSPEEAYQYLTELKKIMQYIDVSDCNMEEGSLRCDANVSIRPKGDTRLGTKAEIKNMNSFRHVRMAIEHEIKRQIKAVENGEQIVQETRLYDANQNTTRSMRSKEEAHDYRYFPCPDLSPQRITAEMIAAARAKLPELPNAKAARMRDAYGLSGQDIAVLIETRALAEYYEAAVAAYPKQPKKIANWIMVEVNAHLNDKGIPITAFTTVPPKHIGMLFKLIDDGVISGKIAKDVFADMITSGDEPSAVIERKGLKQVSDTGAIEDAVKKVIADNAAVVAEFKAGKEKSFGFLVGQVMKATKGQGNPKVVNDILRKMLG